MARFSNSASYVDPSFQMGLALGNAFGDMFAANAKKRQESKADQIIDDIRAAREADNVTAFRQPIQSQTVGERIAADRLQQQMAGMDGNYQLSVPTYLEQLQARDPIRNAVDNANKIGMQAVEDYQKYKSGQATTGVNPNYTVDNVRQKLTAAGLADEVVNKKLDTVKKDIAEKARATLVPQIQNDLYGQYVTTTDKDGKQQITYQPPNEASYGRALANIITLSKYDPETAKVLMSGAITPKDIYAQQAREKMSEQNFQNQVKLAELNAQKQRELLNMRIASANSGVGGQRRRNQYTVSLDEYKAYGTRMKEIEQYADEQRAINPNFTLPQNLYNEYNQLDTLRKQYLSERAPGSNSNSMEYNDEEEVDWNDWNSINAGIDQAINDKKSTKEILNIVENKLGKDHPWYKNIASSFDHSKKSNTQLADSEPGISDYLFNWENRGATRSGPATFNGFGVNASDIAGLVRNNGPKYNRG